MTAEPQGRDVVREILNRGNVVNDWPDDEARAYRENGGFTAGRDAVERIRIDKIVAAVRVEVEAERDALREIIEEARETIASASVPHGESEAGFYKTVAHLVHRILSRASDLPASPAVEGAEG